MEASSFDDPHEYCTGGFDPDDIVISGIAGRFPESKCVGELIESLMARRNLMVPRDDRYEKGTLKLPMPSMGIIQDLDKFDADYFCIPYAAVNGIDPASRKILEVSYECIADAGYDPSALKGAPIGVYCAITNDDAQLLTLTNDQSLSGFSWLRCLSPNRVSYTFDFVGPSFCVDTACSSSAVATWAALQDLQTGRIEAAVINAGQLDLNPQITTVYLKHGISSPTGNSIPFDAGSDGMVRTEAVSAIYLQKAKYARRVYAKICAAKFVTSGFVPEGISVPSRQMQIKVTQEVLEQSGITTDDIDYFECHGTGTHVGDPIELNSLAELFCTKDRKKPLYVGTIKSNIGHTEASSALCGMIKISMAFDSGKIPPNCRFSTPNPFVSPLIEGKLKVVTEPLPVVSPYIPLNSFGLAGTIVQILLKQNPKSREKFPAKKSKLPKFILFCGTTENAVQYVFDYIKAKPDLPDEFFTLLNKLSLTSPFLKPYRGYAFFQNLEAPAMDIKMCPSGKRPVWLIYPGMGCQWRGMGLQLVEIDVYAESLKKCAEVLKPYGVDLFKVLAPDSDELEKHRGIANAIIGISCIQIAMTDLLRSLDIIPDGIIGHSTGECIATYADGSANFEQAVLGAYWRGMCIEQANLVSGAMAAVGLTWEEAEKRCPKNVFAACHNANDSVTISGLKDEVEKFVDELKKENIFAKVVDAYGYCFHCPFTEPTAPLLRGKLKDVFKEPKKRSPRWISTCFVESEWETEKCMYASAEYFTKNMVSPVLFNEAMKKIPSDAITIEIGPHHFFQSIMKRGVGAESTYIGLMRRNDPNNLQFFFEAVGKMYQSGMDPKIENLYPPVQFPVPRGVPCISDLIRWDYSKTYDVPKWQQSTRETAHSFSLQKDDCYLLDHFIDGRSLFPATGFVFLAWELLATKLQKNFYEMPVLIENFRIHRATILNPQNDVKFTSNILSSSGHFEITEGNSLVASGQVSEWKNVTFEEPDPVYESNDSSVPGEDLYDELKLAGYEYKSGFKNLIEMNMEGTHGLVKWEEKWIPYLDSLLLFFGFLSNSSDFQLPVGALSFKIDPNILNESVEKFEEKDLKALPVNYNPDVKICRSVGVEITNLMLNSAHHRIRDEDPLHIEYRFVPSICTYTPDKHSELSLLRYMWACNKLLDTVGQKLKKDVRSYKFCVGSDSGISFEEYRESITESHSLFKCLEEISENVTDIETKKNELYLTFKKTFGKDSLNTIMINDNPLKIILETIEENTFKKINVLEVSNTGFPVVLSSIHEIITKFYLFKIKSSNIVVSPDVEIDLEALEESNIQQQSLDSLEKYANEKDQDLLIGSFLGGSATDLQKSIKTLASCVKPGGFVLYYIKEKLSPPERFLLNLYGKDIQIHPRSTVEKTFHDNNLIVVSKIFDLFSTAVYLLRVVSPPAPYQIIKITDDNEYKWVEDIKASLAADKTDLIWLVAEDTPINGILGMAKSLKQEPGGERIKCIFLCPKKGDSKPPPFDFEHPVYKCLLPRALTFNVWASDSWGSYKNISLGNTKELRHVEHSYVNCKKYGDLSSFEWTESQVKYTDRKDKKLIHIYYSSLNFKDVMLASGKLSVGAWKPVIEENDENVLGFEFSGREESGKRVAGFTTCRGLATSTLVDSHYMFDIPDEWSLEDAATVSVVYGTSYYALIMRAQLERGQKILIHSGTGGIGIAAINIALSIGCEIFTTVGNDDKKKYLMKLFPQIKEENIGCSRNTSFENMVMKKTKGKGVDVVLNSLADDKFLASVRCVARHGKYVEIGKYDLSLNRPIGTKVFMENVSFHGVFLDRLFEKTPHNVAVFKEIMNLIRNGIKEGVVKPLGRTVFKRDEVEQAFRYMAKGIHVGKVVVKIRDEEPDKQAKPTTLVLPAVPSTYFYSSKVYIIIGGVGGFGIEVAKWIISRGGKNIILTSRYGARTPYQFLCLRRWQRAGFNVQVLTLNAAKRNEAELLIKEAMKMGPVGGIFNSAAVLKDAFMDCQSSKAFEEVCAPKAIATKHLDELSRKLCPSLDLFICFSSISGGRGNAGQTNYAYANSVMERICEQRRQAGLPGLAVQWGIIGGVGVVHRHLGEDARILGVVAQNAKSCLESLDLFCQFDYPVVSSSVMASSSKRGNEKDVMSQIIKVLGVKDLSEVAQNRSFGEMGLDSLLGVEIRQLLETNYDIALSMQEIFEMKLSDLQALIHEAQEKIAATQVQPSLVSTDLQHVQLPAMSSNEPLIQIHKESDSKPVFIINLGNVDVSTFILLAQTLERSVYTLQWTKSIEATNMQELAAYFLKLIKPKTRGTCHLIGFSEGGGLALEMTKQDSAAIMSITLLDASAQLESIMHSTKTDNDPEVSALLKLAGQYSLEDTNKLESEIAKAKSLELRIKALSNHLESSSSSVNKNDLTDNIQDFLKKEKIIQSFVPPKKLAKDILLIEDPNRVLANDVAELKFLFSEVVSGKVVIHRVLSHKELTNKTAVNRLVKTMTNEIFKREFNF